jgi:hypothetical protein
MTTRQELIKQHASMTGRLAAICLVAMFLVGISSPAARPQSSEVVSLRGIRAVLVGAWDLDDGAKAMGLTKEAIQADVELKLRLAGMRAVTPDEGVKLPGTPMLYVKVAAPDPALGATVSVQLRQNVLLERNRVSLILIPTWDRTIVVANPTAQHVRDGIKDSVDEFLKTWLSVNPKK